MKWKIDDSRVPGFVPVEITEEFTPDGCMLVLSALMASEHWRSGSPVLFDCSKIDPSPSSGSASETISQALEMFGHLADDISSNCVAILMDANENFLSARQIQYALIVKDLPANIQMFFSKDEAIKWIELCRPADRQERANT